MAVNLFCSKCKASLSLTAKKCSHCTASLASSRKYRVDVKSMDGKRVSRVVDSISTARKLEAKLKTQALEGNLFNVRSIPCTDSVWSLYIDWAKANKKSWKTDLYLWKKHIEHEVRGKQLNRISAALIQTILDNMRSTNRYSQATIKHVLVLIRRIFNWAREMSIYSGSNPTDSIRTPRLNNERIEYLSVDEMIRLTAVLRQWKNRRVAQLVSFALATGIRRGELLSLRWDNVNQEQGFMHIKNPKSGQDAILPLNDAALTILAEAKELRDSSECPFVFPTTSGKQRRCIKRSWERIKQKAHLPISFRFHGLRHTFASHLASSGSVTLYTIQKLLNHKSSRMTQRYAHLHNRTLRDGAQVMDQLLRISPIPNKPN